MQTLISLTSRTQAYNFEALDLNFIGTSDCNMFIPFHAVFNHQLITFADQEVKVVEYALPKVTLFLEKIRQYSQLLNRLCTANSLSCYTFKVGGIDKEIHVHRGLILKDQTILMSLGINTRYVLSTPLTEIASEPDLSKFTLFINNTFDEDATYKNVRKKVEGLYVDPLKKLGVDIVLTNSVESWLYRNNFIQPKFKNVAEMVNHLKFEAPLMF